MKKEVINGITIEMYEDIDELPILNYNSYNEYALLDYEIGSTIQDIAKRFEKLDRFLGAEKIPEAIQERKNLHFLFHNMLSGVNYPSLQFACFIHSVNGKKLHDLRQESLQVILDNLSKKGLSIGSVFTLLKGLKKKLQSN